jgi:hypothetical protein
VNVFFPLNALGENMRITILNEHDRIGAKSYQVTDGQVAWEDPRRAFKFIVVGDDFIIGPFDRHDTLYGLFFTRMLSPDEVDKNINSVIDEYGMGVVTSAGSVSESGIVTSWTSTGYSVRTPQNVRPGIEKIVTDLYAKGALAVQNLPVS